MMRIRQNRHQAAKKFNRSTARTKRINVARWDSRGTASSRGVLRATVRNPDAQRETAGPSATQLHAETRRHQTTLR